MLLDTLFAAIGPLSLVCSAMPWSATMEGLSQDGVCLYEVFSGWYGMEAL